MDLLVDRPEARVPGLAVARGWVPLHQIQEQEVQAYAGLGPDLGLNALVQSHPQVRKRVQVQELAREPVAWAQGAAWV